MTSHVTCLRLISTFQYIYIYIFIYIIDLFKKLLRMIRRSAAGAPYRDDRQRWGRRTFCVSSVCLFFFLQQNGSVCAQFPYKGKEKNKTKTPLR